MNGRSQDSTGPESHTIDLGQTGTAELGATVFLPAEESGPLRPVEARVLGRYENLGEIARGGMGMVYRVRDLVLERELALKVMLVHHPGPEPRRRFVEEARVAGQLQHPGIPPVHEIRELEDGRPYYTMELIDCHDLAPLLADRPDPRHDLARFVSIFQSICQTLGFAHARGVVHRDMKPENVMVGAFGEIQVMDWGLAKALG